jgi:Cdc6-like AAA superfamily ATPase
MKKSNKTKKKEEAKFITKALTFILKSPYYLIKGIYKLSTKTSKEIAKGKTKQKRKKILANYEEFNELKTIAGDYNKWFKKVGESDSQIGIILGARGTGKTAFGVKFLENLYSRYKKQCFAIGFNAKEFPSWINIVKDISKLENDSVVLIDEGGVLFSSRSSMSNANKLLSELIMIARHKNLSVIFISQNSSNLEVNILRQADFLVLKSSSLLQKEFERSIIQKIYTKIEDQMKKYSEDLGITYIYSGTFKGFVSNPLPSFWQENISKSFK